MAKEQSELNIIIQKKGQLLIEQSNIEHIKAEVSDSSALIFDKDAVVGIFELKLKDKSQLRDNNAQIAKVSSGYISDSASLVLSGRVLRMLKQR